MLEKIKRVIYKVAIYIRLSKEDVDKGFDESESIVNQRKLLIEYVEKLGWEYELVDTYIDPGYTGTNFNRPDFQRMVHDIELGKINMVITKDLSRLGRDYIETGEYIEKWFPEHEVRYVSVTDGIDTFAKNNGNNDIAPFKSILNDMYSKDLSKKIKTALHTMQTEGKWTVGKTALGYKRNPKDNNHLIICEEEAKIVRNIFDMAYSGKQIGEIKKWLIDNKVPTASQIRYNKATFWENKTVKQILTNPIYIGTTIQNKRSRISYKNRKLKANPKEQWIIVENTHEPIIEKDIFNTIQKMVIAQKYNRNEKKNKFLLDGLIVCYECKHKIGIRGAETKGAHWMVCNNYRRNPKLKLCTSHGFNYNKLEKMVLEYVRKLFLDIENNKIEFNIKKHLTQYDYTKMLEKLELEMKLINENVDKMYIDKLNGKVSEEMYNRLFEKMKKEIEQKEKEYIELRKMKENDLQDNDAHIKEVVKEFLSLKNPTPEIMKLIINKIELHQDKQVDIIFNFKRLSTLESIRSNKYG